MPRPTYYKNETRRLLLLYLLTTLLMGVPTVCDIFASPIPTIVEFLIYLLGGSLGVYYAHQLSKMPVH